MLATHERAFSIMSGNRRRRTIQQWDGPPLLYIRPEAYRFETLDFEHIDEMIESGRIAAEVALEATPLNSRAVPSP